MSALAAEPGKPRRRSPFYRLSGVALVLLLVVGVSEIGVPKPSGIVVSGCATAREQQAAFALDGVSLSICTPFLPAGGFIAADPDSMSQVAFAASFHPYRELSLTAIPFGTSPATEELPVANADGADAYRSALRSYRAKQGGHPQIGPIIRIFDQQVAGQVNIVTLPVEADAPRPTLVVEWIAEGGQRLWLVRVAVELANDVSVPSLINSLHGIALNSSNLDAQSTSTGRSAMVASPPSVPSASGNTTSSLSIPTWWHGTQCDTYHHPGSFPLQGGSYLGVVSCGPEPINGASDVQVQFTNSNGTAIGTSQLEWECVEYVMRFMYLDYGVIPYPANGNQVVANYRPQYGGSLVAISNGTQGQAPQPGDVLSYGPTSTSGGHTSVVSASSVVNGSGSITIVDQNGTKTYNIGTHTANVLNWAVTDKWTGQTIIGWLHNSSSPPPPTATPTPMPPPTYYVAPPPAGNDNNNCLSPTTPCATIGAAIAKATPNSTINIAAGAYDEHLSISKSLTLKGAGASQTLIDGGQAGNVITATNPSGSLVTLANITVQHSGSGWSGILNQGANLLVHNSTVTGNGEGIDNQGSVTVTNSTLSVNSQGGIQNYGSLTMAGSLVTNNTGAVQGGGVNNSGSITVTNSIISNNSAGRGGGLFNFSFATATLVSTTVRNNAATDCLLGESGGGISVQGGTVNVTNSTISGNSATAGGCYGGGIWVGGGTLIVSKTTLSGNTASSLGSALSTENALSPVNVKIVDCNITQNTSDSHGAITNGLSLTSIMLIFGSAVHNNNGGGIENSSTMTVINTMINSNTGAGIEANSGNGVLTITGSTVNQNQGDGIGGSGATIAISNSQVMSNTGNGIAGSSVLTARNDLISGNAGGGVIGNNMAIVNSTMRQNGGDGVADIFGPMTITNSTVSSNGGSGITASPAYNPSTITNSTISGNGISGTVGGQLGGGINEDSNPMFAASMTVNNSTISGNIGVYGGVTNYGGAVKVADDTISGNTSSSYAGGIYTTVPLTLANTIDANNSTSAPGVGPDCFGPLVSLGYNILGNNSGCSGLTNGVKGDQVGTSNNPINPLLDSLQNNGGPTETQALLPSSPAIDWIPGPYCSITTDQRGQPRPDGPSDNGFCDIGAYESQGVG